MTLHELLRALGTNHPDLSFVAGEAFYWSPSRQEIIYNEHAESLESLQALIHEVGHALLGHKRYATDFELLQMEVAAWQEAKRIAPTYDITIDEDHIQDCLDSYRDWLFRRSICPRCKTIGLQQDHQPTYRCHNCHTTWNVSTSRFCRPYRQNTATDTVTVLLP